MKTIFAVAALLALTGPASAQSIIHAPAPYDRGPVPAYRVQSVPYWELSAFCAARTGFPDPNPKDPSIAWQDYYATPPNATPNIPYLPAPWKTRINHCHYAEGGHIVVAVPIAYSDSSLGAAGTISGELVQSLIRLEEAHLRGWPISEPGAHF